MLGPAPQTKANDIIQRLSAIRRGQRFIGKDFVYARLVRDIDIHLNISKTEGWVLKGMLASCIGDLKATEHALNNALRLRVGSESYGNIISTYAGVGMCSRAVAFFQDYGEPEKGQFSNLLLYGLTCGAFQTAVSYWDKAEKMQIDLSAIDPETVDNARLVASILKANNIDDSYVASYLDLAGKVFTEQGRFFDVAFSVFVDESIVGHATINLVIEGGHKEAFEFNKVLARKEIESNIVKYPCLDVVFSAD